MILNAEVPLPKAFPCKLDTVGDHIRAIRLRRKLGLAQVAELLDVTKYTVNNWESGRNSPRVPQCMAIIKFLGYDPFPQAETFPEELIAFRRVRGLRVRVAAELAGGDPCSWTSWENGEHRITKPCREKMDRLLRSCSDPL